MAKPNERSKYTDKLIAHHEAGHAVMAFHRGAKFTCITIDVNFPGDIDAALVDLKWPSKKRTKKNKALVLLAGISAVAILTECLDEYREDRNRTDIEKFFKLWATKTQGLSNWEKFHLEAVKFLLQTTVWRQVEVVATTLLKERVLTYDEVQLCIESVVDKKRKRDFKDYLELNTMVCHRRKPY